MTVRFEAHGQKDSQKVNGRVVMIASSRAFTPLKGFSLGEMVQLSLAFVAAVTTGLQTFYFKAGGFGSLPDYLTLFAWGARNGVRTISIPSAWKTLSKLSENF